MTLSKELCTMLGAVGGDIDLFKIYNEIGELIDINETRPKLNLQNYFGLTIYGSANMKNVLTKLGFEIVGNTKNTDTYIFDTYGNIGEIRYKEGYNVVLVDMLHPED